MGFSCLLGIEASSEVRSTASSLAVPDLCSDGPTWSWDLELMAPPDEMPLDGSCFCSRFGALRLVRWTTSPEGSISLTRKSVYEFCYAIRSLFCTFPIGDYGVLVCTITPYGGIRTWSLGQRALHFVVERRHFELLFFVGRVECAAGVYFHTCMFPWVFENQVNAG